MTTGTVKWFSVQKGFGFIAPDGGGNDAFVHISAVERSGLGDLREGQKVGFELVADRKSGKMSAENLKDLADCAIGGSGFPERANILHRLIQADHGCTGVLERGDAAA